MATKISAQKLKSLISEEVMKAMMKEAALDREFHYIMLHYLNAMIKNNEIHLSHAEQEKNGGKNFLSLTRNRSNQQGFQYGRYVNSDFSHAANYARIEFDGQALNNVRNVKVKPYDYAYNEDSYGDMEKMNGKQYHQSAYENDDWAQYDDDDAMGLKHQFFSQAEDRLMTDADSIPNPLKYITRIDVMVRDEEKPDFQEFQLLLRHHPEWQEKVQIHMDDKSFNMMNENQPPQNGRLQRVTALNKQLWAIKKETDALGLESASKWIYMAIQAIDREYATDTIKNGWNKAKEAVQGIIKEGNEN